MSTGNKSVKSVEHKEEKINKSDTDADIVPLSDEKLDKMADEILRNN